MEIRRVFRIALILHLLFLVSMASSTPLTRSKSIGKRKVATIAKNDVTSERALGSVPVRVHPCGDDLDKRILTLAFPAIVNLIVFPIVGALDTYCIGQMQDKLALSGHSAATQVYASCHWIMSFFPAVLTPLVAKAHSAGNVELVKEKIGEAMLIAAVVGVFGTTIMSVFPGVVLKMVLKGRSEVFSYAQPYLRTRAFCIAPSLLSTVAFSAFRGTYDVVEPLKISVIMCLLNAILDYLFMFIGKQGVVGVALAKVLCELVAMTLYLRALVKRDLFNLSSFKIPALSSLYPLLGRGLSVQMRSLVLNFAYVQIARSVQQLDDSGTSAAAHAIVMQVWQMGLFTLIGLATVASIMVPGEIAKVRSATPSGTDVDREASLAGRAVANRLLCWGVMFGTVLGVLQVASLPLLAWFTNDKAVQEVAVVPSLMGAVMLVVNGFVVVGEAIQQGNQCYNSLTVSTALSTIAMMLALKVCGGTLQGVWICSGVLNLSRMMGVIVHHFIMGPLAGLSRDRSISHKSVGKIE